MKVELFCHDLDLSNVERIAREAEACGFDAIAIPEITGDPFLSIAAAARGTTRIALHTAIAVAFPRSPMITAATAWSLQTNSKGRFTLGLGTQVKGHNERRFGVKWEKPAERLIEYAEALRAVWRCWEKREKLSYVGKHYQLTLMTPEFSPPPSGLPRVPIYFAAVRPTMLEVAGRAADGVRLHGFCTRRYLEEVAWPRLRAGLAEQKRDRASFEVTGGGFIATGPDEDSVRAAFEGVRYRVAFYASTRTYLPVMELHGWGDLAEDLHRMSVSGRWKDMAARVPDDIVHEFCACATHANLKSAVEKRFSGLVDNIALGDTIGGSRPALAEVVKDLQALPSEYTGQPAFPLQA